MQNSKIEWTDHTFNPWWGCVNVSPACDHCYAERFANRKTRTDEQLWGKDSVRFPASEKQWEDPVRWNKKAEKLGVPMVRQGVSDVVSDMIFDWMEYAAPALGMSVQQQLEVLKNALDRERAAHANLKKLS